MRKDEQGPMMPGETPSERPPAPGAEDPIASLFSADRTLPAPVVAPEVNESEMTRWKSARDSLFGDLVKDPPTSEPSVVGPPPSRTGRTLGGDASDEPLKEKPQVVLAAPPPAAKAPASKPREEGRSSDSGGTPLVRALSVAKIGHQHEAGRDPTKPAGSRAEDLAPPSSLPKLDVVSLPNKKRTAQHAGAPPPPASSVASPPALGKREPTPAGKKARPDTGPVGARTRKKTPPVRPEPSVEAAARTKRLRRGPKPLLLAALALLVLAAGGVSAVVLEIVPDPFAEPPPPVARGLGQTPAPAAKPAAVAPAAPVMAAAPASAPATPATKSAAAKSAAAAAKPVVVAQPAQAAAPSKPAAPVAVAASPELDEATASAGVDQLVALARKTLSKENAVAAEALARRALAKSDDDHHAMEVLARALIDQDRGVEAVQFARRIVEKRKNRVPYRLLLGDALLMVGDANGARKEWQVAAAIEPGNREVAQRLR